MGVIERVVKAKTHRGKRELEKRGAKVIENAKKSLLLRGTRCDADVQKLMKDMTKLKKLSSILLSRKNEYRPFEAANEIETLCRRYDASLFGFGSHNKKRPRNLILGRMFNFQILDMVEFGVRNFKSLDDFKNAKVAVGVKPCILFAGEQFLTPSSNLFRIKNLLIDFFRGEEITNIRLEGIEHALFFTAVDNTIYMRSYRIILRKSGEATPYAELEEIGPAADLVLRRSKLASADLFKSSCKKPMEVKVRKVKNISNDCFGSQLGRVHMPRQDLRRLSTRTMKGLKKTTAEKKVERVKHVRFKNPSGRDSNSRNRGAKKGAQLTGANTAPLALPRGKFPDSASVLSNALTT